MAILRWVWATYQTLALWQWLLAIPIGAGGLAAVPIIGYVSGWPLWLQAVASSGVALVWLTVFTGLVRLMTKKNKVQQKPGQSQENSPNAQQQQATGAGGDILQAGRDIIMPQSPASQPVFPWIRRPGAPNFRMHPGIHPPQQLLNTFYMNAEVTPGEMQARWVAPGIDMEFVTPMPQNTPNQYQMKGVQMSPGGTEDTVIFEVRFWLDDGEHGGRWIWPVQKHPKGHWELRAELGSGVFQPKLEDTW